MIAGVRTCHTSQPTMSHLTSLIYLYACLQPGATTRTLKCPSDSRPFVRLGELGAGLSVTDVTDKLRAQCSNPTACTLDMAALGLTYQGQTLRVEWFCSCLPGYYDRAPGDGLPGTCQPCQNGTYKSLGMIDCKASGPNWLGRGSLSMGPNLQIRSIVDRASESIPAKQL
jgi:hypothetical protein